MSNRPDGLQQPRRRLRQHRKRVCGLEDRRISSLTRASLASMFSNAQNTNITGGSFSITVNGASATRIRCKVRRNSGIRVC